MYVRVGSFVLYDQHYRPYNLWIVSGFMDGKRVKSRLHFAVQFSVTSCPQFIFLEMRFLGGLELFKKWFGQSTLQSTLVLGLRTDSSLIQ